MGDYSQDSMGNYRGSYRGSYDERAGRDGDFGIGYNNAVVGKFYLAAGTTYGGSIVATTGATNLLSSPIPGLWAGIATSSSIWLTGYYGGNNAGWAIYMN